MNNSLCIAFVDPIISPIYLAEVLRQYQVKIIAVFSVQLVEEEKRKRLHPEVFDEVIYCDKTTDVSLIAQQLRNLGVHYIFYGYESSVYFTDVLASLICPLYANDPATAEFRNDKSAMQEALKKQRIPEVKQIKINVETISHYANELKNWHFPVIIKPIHGGLSIGVKKCDSFEEIVQFIKFEQHVLLHTEEAKEYVVQEYLEGIEYFADTVSLVGKHSLVSVQYYEKIFYKGFPIYRFCSIVDPESKEWTICRDFVLQVLDAVGLKNGFGHTELFITANGPRLIEVNPRISGLSGFANLLAEQTLHTNQPKALIERITGVPYEEPSKLFCNGRIVLLHNWKSRAISELNIKLLKTLSSYSEYLLFKKSGDVIESPKSLRDTVALILLVIAITDKAQLMHDYETINSWEKDNQLF